MSLIEANLQSKKLFPTVFDSSMWTAYSFFNFRLFSVYKVDQIRRVLCKNSCLFSIKNISIISSQAYLAEYIHSVME